jgi:polyisoprenoid-binding protein YceI
MSTTIERQTAIPAGTWQIDPVHSTVGFEVAYQAGTYRGTFREVEAKLENGKLSGSAKVASVDVKDENLNAHLQSPEFFDAERHPELRFETSELRLDGENVEAPGALTIRGITKPVTFTGTARGPLTDAFGKERIGFQVSATVDRTEFGLNWNMDLPSGGKALGNEVKILIDAQFVQAQA